MRPVECEPANWDRDCFSRFNEHGGYIWCKAHYCWHWIDVPAASTGAK